MSNKITQDEISAAMSSECVSVTTVKDVIRYTESEQPDCPFCCGSGHIDDAQLAIAERDILRAQLAASEQRVKALEAVVVKVREDKIPEYDRLKFENAGLKKRVKALEDALLRIAETPLSTELSCMEYSSDTVDKWYDETIVIARKALEATCQK